MRLTAIAALQLLETFSHFSDSATLPSQHLASRDQTRETRQEFDETTTILKEQGLCRFYPDSTDKRGNELGTCEPKCGDLVKKDVDAGGGNSVGCTAGGDSIPGHTDPDGDKYHSGQCVCEVPTSDQLVDGVLLTLPIVTDIGCPILYSAFDAILDAGEAAISGERTSMDVGMKAAIQAAKTVSSSGGKASSFLDWFDHPCGDNKYANVINQIFGPLSNVSNDFVLSTDTNPTNGKEKRSPKGGRGGGGAGGRSSASSGGGGGGSKGGSGPVSGSKPKVPTPKGKTPQKKDEKKVQSSKAAKKPSPTTAEAAAGPTHATNSEKKKQPLSHGNGKGTAQATTPTKSVASKLQQTSPVIPKTSIIKGTSSTSAKSSQVKSQASQSTALTSTLEVSTVPKPSSTVPAKAILNCPAKSVTNASTVDDERLVKRADVGGGAEIRMRMASRLGGTYYGFAPFNYDIDCWELGEYAIRGYRQISTQPGITDGTIIVAAIWIATVGVVVGSKPRAGVGSAQRGEDAIAQELRGMAQAYFPVYWNLVSGRRHLDRTGPLDVWHAEDVALIFGGYEWSQAMAFRDPHRTTPPVLRHFRWQAESLAYGKYNRHDQVGFKPACGQGNVDGARMQPPCADVLTDLGIAWIRTPPP